jgi:hypothetical protein
MPVIFETLTMMAGSAGVVIASLKGWRWHTNKERKKQEAIDLITYGMPVLQFSPEYEASCPRCGVRTLAGKMFSGVQRSNLCQCEEIHFSHFHCSCGRGDARFLGFKIAPGCGAKWIMKTKDQSVA